MKKTKMLGMLLLAGMFTLTAAAVSAQTPAEGTKLAKAVYGTPDKIDGELDAGWDSANTYRNESFVGDDVYDEIDAEWKVMYDNAFLYFFVDVNDATLGDEEYEYVGNSTLWSRNSIHIMLDLGYERTSSHDSNDFRFDVGCRGDYWCHMPDAWDYVEYAVAETDDGYSVEMRVDFAYYDDFVPEGGTCFGLDVWANDNIPPISGRMFAQTWSDSTDSSWKNPTMMGTVQLEAAPEGAAVTEKEEKVKVDLQKIPVEGTVYAEAVYGTPAEIDGVLDAGWNNAKTVVNENCVGDPANDKIDAQWKVMYDENRIYYFIEVTDPTVGDAGYEDITDGKGWSKSSIHIMLDLGYERKNVYDKNDFRFDIGSHGSFYSHGEYGNGHVEYKTALTETGYVIEVGIDHTGMEDFEAEEGTCFGCDIWVNDNDPDQPGTRLFAATFSDTTDSSWQNPTKMGTVQLTAAPGTPVSEVVEEPVETETVIEPAETEPAAEPAEETAAPEADKPAETAPQTFDIGIFAVAAAAVSALGWTVARKRR